MDIDEAKELWDNIIAYVEVKREVMLFDEFDTEKDREKHSKKEKEIEKKLIESFQLATGFTPIWHNPVTLEKEPWFKEGYWEVIEQEPDRSSHVFYQITKFFRGGKSIYYASHHSGFEMTKENWDYQFEDWGESTSGGHEDGYRITATTIDRVPEDMKSWQWLAFNLNYLKVKEEKK